MLLAAHDTKGAQIAYLGKALRKRGLVCKLADMELASSRSSKAAAMEAKATELAEQLARQPASRAYLALGGGSGSWIAASVLPRLPLGLPKTLVTTLAFDPRPMVAGSDLTLISSPTDLVGDAPQLRAALDAAVRTVPDHFIAPCEHSGKTVAVTALGVIDGCVAHTVDALRGSGWQASVFHAAGANGGALARRLRAGGGFAGLLDLAGNDQYPLPSGRHGWRQTRWGAAVEGAVPTLVVPGCLDFVTRDAATAGPVDARRGSYLHSPQFAHFRSSEKQVAKAGGLLAEASLAASGRMRVLIPAGWSRRNRKGGALHAPSIDGALLRVLEQKLPRGTVKSSGLHINDARFARQAVKILLEMLERPPRRNGS